jgi:hypothetical protein
MYCFAKKSRYFWAPKNGDGRVVKRIKLFEGKMMYCFAKKSRYFWAPKNGDGRVVKRIKLFEG